MLHYPPEGVRRRMAQLQQDEWPTDSEPTTTEREVPATNQADHERATEEREQAMKDRLDLRPPVEHHKDDE